MNLQHVNIKFFVEGELDVDLEQIIELFHQWVADQSMPEMLIDVADYRHVPDGPGVVLVGLESDYAIDHAGGHYGLLYNRKGELPGSNEDRIRHSVRLAAGACRLLESAFPSLRFQRDRLEVIINDRALAPNTAEAREACRTVFAECLGDILGNHSVELVFDLEPRNRLAACAALSKPLDFESLA